MPTKLNIYYPESGKKYDSFIYHELGQDQLQSLNQVNYYIFILACVMEYLFICIFIVGLMNNVREFILECDFFAHGSLQRYKEEEAFRTLAGGIVSIVLIIFFVIVFSNLAINTFQKNIIISSESRLYYDDPTYSEITADPDSDYMFAVGLTGIDLSSTQRYFDITLTNRTYTKNGTNTIKTTKVLSLSPCTIDQWSGVSDSIKKSYTALGFSQWLCPPKGTVFPLQGKFTSDIFKFAQITVSKCTNNTLYPNTTCKTSTDITSFLASNGQFTFNFYFINPVINPQNPQFISYYLEDTNYFAFDTLTGISANIYYSDYTVTTDTTLLPWNENEEVSGSLTEQAAIDQSYQISNSSSQYLKFYIRKAPHQTDYTRSFQKLDQTFSYIGGLFGTIVLILMFLKFYSKYSYELNLGDKIFKQNNGGSFGSQNFNFVVFMGYLVFVIFSKFGIILNWKTMKRYHKCRMQCQKQLNIDLLFNKIAHLEEIARIVLQQHHLKMLMMVPKPTIKDVKLNRKRYLMKNIVYNQLQRKGRDILVDQHQYQKKLQQLLRQNKHPQLNQMIEGQEKSENSFKQIQQQMATSYKKLQGAEDDHISKKIKDRLVVKDVATAIFQFMKPEFIRTQSLKQGCQSQMKRINVKSLGSNFQQSPDRKEPTQPRLDSSSDIISIPSRKNLFKQW